MRPLVRIAGLAVTALALTTAVSQAHAAERHSPAQASTPPPPAAAPVAQEVFAPNGTIRHVSVPAAATPHGFVAKKLISAHVTPLQQTGPSDQRFDLVFVGDGYTAAQLDKYHQDAAAKWAMLSSVAPFSTYKNKFNVWMVDVVSTQSGVDNDPSVGVDRATALGMKFWCANMERLLCVDNNAARAYAANAPQVDQIVAVANSSKYGGSGGAVAAASGGNTNSGQIVVHELGHSLGHLADEYDYPYGAYSGPEVGEANVTTSPSGQKWASYLGKPTPDGGVIGAFPGARYYTSGIYRPSENSIMRTLGRPYNLIGLDAMTKAITSKLGSAARK